METITVNVPINLMDVTLSQYQRIVMISHEEDFRIKARAYCSIFFNMAGDVVDRTPQRDLIKLINDIDEVICSEPEFQQRFTHNEIEYGFIPDLDRITAGEWVDIETIGFDVDKLHKLMAILYRPISQTIGKKYLIESYSGQDGEKFKEAPAGIIIGSMVFFYRIVNQCMRSIQSSKEMIQKSTKLGKDSVKNGDGTAR